MSDPKIRKCEKCGSHLIGFDYIKKHVYGVMETGKDPRTASGRQNTLNIVKGLHRVVYNDQILPCIVCINEYNKMINDAIYSYKNK